MTTCPICNIAFKQLYFSHFKKHGLSTEEFKNKFPNISFRNENTYIAQLKAKSIRAANDNIHCKQCDCIISAVNRKRRKFCSKSCSASFNNKNKKETYSKTCKSKCNFCDKEYDVLKYRLSISKYCSARCAAKHRRGKYISINCDYCKNIFEIKEKKLHLSVNHFCNNDCKMEFYKANPHIRGIFAGHNGKSVKSNYRNIAFNLLEHRCHICKYDRFEDVLQVHHIDHNRKNNDISNLVIVCPTCHSEIHKGYVLVN